MQNMIVTAYIPSYGSYLSFRAVLSRYVHVGRAIRRGHVLTITSYELLVTR